MPLFSPTFTPISIYDPRISSFIVLPQNNFNHWCFKNPFIWLKIKLFHFIACLPKTSGRNLCPQRGCDTVHLPDFFASPFGSWPESAHAPPALDFTAASSPERTGLWQSLASLSTFAEAVSSKSTRAEKISDHLAQKMT